MRRSIKSKLVWALTSLVAFALISNGGLLIWQNVQQMRKEIYLDALTFAELTNDRIVTSFEQFYETENYLQFRKELNPLVNKSADIRKIEILGKSGQLFYDSSRESETAYLGEDRKHNYDIDRSRDIKASLLFSNGEIVYVSKSEDDKWIPQDRYQVVREFPSGEVVNILFPHVNARLSVMYSLSYEALKDRIFWSVISIISLLVLSIFIMGAFALSIAGRLVGPIKILEKGVLKVGDGAFGTQVKIDSNDEIGVLAQTFNSMSKKLKKDTRELLEKEKITKELDIAREIQQNMLPSEDPRLKGLQVSGSLDAATAIGGDIYDYLTGNKGSYIFIADVTGHGVPAGMVANITHSTLYSYIKVYSETDQIMKAMNDIVHAKTQPNMFATALLARWDDNNRRLYYCNAGHEEIIHYQAETQQLSLIGKGGIALGMTADTEKLYIQRNIEIKTGDVLILYTDGIPEAWKTKKENLGMDAFIEIVKSAVNKNRSAKGIRKGILKRVTEFRANYPQQDDITLVVLLGL